MKGKSARFIGFLVFVGGHRPPLQDFCRGFLQHFHFVRPPAFGKGYGAAIAATAADRLVATEGRLVCAGIHLLDERTRPTLQLGAAFQPIDPVDLGGVTVVEVPRSNGHTLN